MPIRDPRVFTIPAGAPFLPTFSRALVDGELIEGFPGSGGPLALAGATVYVPTQRAAAALAEALLAASGGESVLLPRIAPLGAFEPEDAATFFDPASEDAPRPGVPPGVGALARRHALALLVRKWGQALEGAICGADADRLLFDRERPALVASSPAQAYALAADLAALIDDMTIEGVDWRRIETLAPEEYDRYWRITLDFLKIAFAHWPEWLRDNGLVDRAKRTALLVEAEIKALETGARRGPTIIAGSTGANRATAELIAAIARSEAGAVVLPALDMHLDEAAWNMIGARGDAPQGLAGHPQALLHRLIGRIGVRRGDVRTLGAPPASARRACGVPQRSAAPGGTRPTSGAGAKRRLRRRRRRRPRRRVDHRRRKRNRGGARACDRHARGARDAGQDRGARHARPVDRPARVGGACALGRRGRGLRRSHARPERGRRPRPSRPQGRCRLAADQRPGADRPFRGAFRPRRAPNASARPGRSSSESFAPRRSVRSTNSTRPSPPRGPLPATGASTARSGRSTTWRRAAGESLARDLVAALDPLRARCASAPLREWLLMHRAALDAALAAPEGDRSGAARARGADRLMDDWSEAAGDGFACTLAEYAALFDEALAGVRAPPARGGHPPSQNPGSARSAPALVRPRPRRRPRRNGLAARGRHRRLSQPADARPARPLPAGAPNRADGARLSLRARRARGDSQPRQEARRRADRPVALSPAHRRGRRRRCAQGGRTAGSGLSRATPALSTGRRRSRRRSGRRRARRSSCARASSA